MNSVGKILLVFAAVSLVTPAMAKSRLATIKLNNTKTAVVTRKMPVTVQRKQAPGQKREYRFQQVMTYVDKNGREQQGTTQMGNPDLQRAWGITYLNDNGIHGTRLRWDTNANIWREQ